MFSYIYVYKYMHVDTHTYVYKCIYIYIYNIHTYIYIYVHLIYIYTYVVDDVWGLCCLVIGKLPQIIGAIGRLAQVSFFVGKYPFPKSRNQIDPGIQINRCSTTPWLLLNIRENGWASRWIITIIIYNHIITWRIISTTIWASRIVNMGNNSEYIHYSSTNHIITQF